MKCIIKTFSIVVHFTMTKLNFKHHYSSLQWSFRNRKNLICCSKNISYYFL